MSLYQPLSDLSHYGIFLLTVKCHTTPHKTEWIMDKVNATKVSDGLTPIPQTVVQSVRTIHRWLRWIIGLVGQSCSLFLVFEEEDCVQSDHEETHGQDPFEVLFPI
jgi:hypothetical protein